MQFCPKCGNQLPDGMRFCNKCGTMLNQPAAPQPAPQLAPQPTYVIPQEPAPAWTPPVAPKKRKNTASTLAAVLIIIGVVLVLVFGVVWYTDAEKEFTCQDLTMEVPLKMKDVSSNAEFKKDYTFTLDSNSIAIFGIRETFEELDIEADDLTLREYTEIVAEANNQNVMVVDSGTEFCWYTYQASTDEGYYTYFVAAFKGDDTFWLVQIAGPNLNINNAHQIAKTVTID